MPHVLTNRPKNAFILAMAAEQIEFLGKFSSVELVTTIVGLFSKLYIIAIRSVLRSYYIGY